MLTVVTGPPCAGKSSYIRARASSGDIIIDFDELAGAFGSDHSHDHPAAVVRVAQAAWNAALSAAITCHTRGTTVWVIDARPSPGRWERYTRAGAVYVHLTADRAELERRAVASGRSPATLRRIANWKDAPNPAATPASRRW